VTTWHQTHLIDPVAGALSLVDIGGEVHDQALVDLLAIGVEGLFRSEIRHQFVGWPPESSTDGSVPFVCWRSRENVLQLVGLTYLDFAGFVFPFRAEFGLDRTTGDAAVDVFVGQVDDETGGPPRLPSSTVIVAVRSGDRVSSAELIAGRRQIPIGWTQAIHWDNASGST
jgi:hypothetical protein